MFIDKDSSFIYYAAWMIFYIKFQLLFVGAFITIQKKNVQNIYFVYFNCIFYILKLRSFHYILHFKKNNERVKMTTIFKCFIFGEYSSWVNKARGCRLHVFLAVLINSRSHAGGFGTCWPIISD